MEDYYEKRISRRLQDDDYKPAKLGRLAKELGITDEDYPAFEAAFERMREAGHVVHGHGNTISLQPMPSQIIGRFRANPKGFGFVIPREPNTQGDLFIPANEVGDAMTGDIVVAQVLKKHPRGRESRISGTIVEILERSHSRIVGVLEKLDQAWCVIPDGREGLDPVHIEDIQAKQARLGDKVVAEIVTYPTSQSLAQGVLVSVLGRAGQYEGEIASVIERFHLRAAHNDACVEQARSAAAAFDPTAIAEREDLTAYTILTIDPPDAKDFDDAISIERDEKGQWILGVHIADVSHFIPADSALDQEAGERGNSVYLPQRTLPMLPEILSNGICSLQPEQIRFTKSAFITYNDQGKVVSRRCANTVIRSTQRLTYLEADAALKGKPKDLNSPVLTLLKNMETLSQVIEARRRRAGMLHLDLPETEIDFDATGLVSGAHPAENSYPHTIIEMFMVEANDAVAGLLDRHNIPFIRRIHPAPDPATLKNLTTLVKLFGYNLGKEPDRHALQDLLAAVKNQDCSLAVNLSVLRSLAKAEYAPLHIGHYALASPCYAHFTSPIRRYADLLLHRQLQFLLEGRIDLARRIGKSQDLTQIGKHISHTEQNAEDAERDLKAVLILQHLSNHLGEELKGVVTGLTNSGIFVRCQPYGIEGLIRMPDLGDDYWDYQSQSHCIVGQRTGATIILGQSLKVRIATVNVAGRFLNLVPAESLLPAAGKKKKRSTKKTTKRQSTQKSHKKRKGRCGRKRR
ncbi:ribonuclease R [Planctomycetota bacterium]